MKEPIPGWGNSLLPDMCILLRMSLDGSADPMPEEETKKHLAYLQHRLDTWQPSIKQWAMVDDAVRLLVTVTIKECEALLRR